jgi:type II secretory pathway pseudopilin PulG
MLMIVIGAVIVAAGIAGFRYVRSRGRRREIDPASERAADANFAAYERQRDATRPPGTMGGGFDGGGF